LQSERILFDAKALVRVPVAAEFEARMHKLVEWLRKQPESCIALVCHWGVLGWLTKGKSFKNAEIYHMYI